VDASYLEGSLKENKQIANDVAAILTNDSLLKKARNVIANETADLIPNLVTEPTVQVKGSDVVAGESLRYPTIVEGFLDPADFTKFNEFRDSGVLPTAYDLEGEISNQALSYKIPFLGSLKAAIESKFPVNKPTVFAEGGLPIVFKPNEKIGFHTNDPQVTAALIENGYSIPVTKAQEATLNPSIVVEKGFVKRVNLIDGPVESATPAVAPKKRKPAIKTPDTQAAADTAVAAAEESMMEPVLNGTLPSSLPTLTPVTKPESLESQIDKEVKKISKRLDDRKDIRAAFNELATQYGLENVESIPSETLVKLFRNEIASIKTQTSDGVFVAALNKIEPETRTLITPSLKSIGDLVSQLETARETLTQANATREDKAQAATSGSNAAGIALVEAAKAQPVQPAVATTPAPKGPSQSVTLADKEYTVDELWDIKDEQDLIARQPATDMEALRKIDEAKKLSRILGNLLKTTKKDSHLVRAGRIYYSQAVNPTANMAEVLKSNIAQLKALGLRSGDINSAIAALDRVPKELKQSVKLLQSRLDILSRVNVQVVTLPNTRWAGMFDEASNTVFINQAATDGRGIAHTLVHEMFHAVTKNLLNSPDPAAKVAIARLESLRTKLREQLIANGDANSQTLAGVSACVVGGVDLAVNNWFIPLAAGDNGIREIDQMQLSAAVATGTLDCVIGHPIAANACPVANMACLDDGLYTSMNLTSILDDACLTFLELPKPATTATNYGGILRVVSE